MGQWGKAGVCELRQTHRQWRTGAELQGKGWDYSERYSRQSDLCAKLPRRTGFQAETSISKISQKIKRAKFHIAAKPYGLERKSMKAIFLESVEINDGKRKMTVEKGEVFTVASSDADYYELRREDGWGTLAPKSAEGTIFEIEED